MEKYTCLERGPFVLIKLGEEAKTRAPGWREKYTETHTQKKIAVDFKQGYTVGEVCAIKHETMSCDCLRGRLGTDRRTRPNGLLRAQTACNLNRHLPGRHM